MRQLPSDINDKINQSLQTIGNNANPKMEITVARAKSTITDSTYWTVETIRNGYSLGDISIAPQRSEIFGAPNRLYEIHVNNGEVKTSIREYPDKFKEGWKDQFSLGSGKSVGIAFDGDWELYRGKWRFITEENPWIYWVNDLNELYCQYWDQPGTRLKLAGDVLKCKAIRGWKTLKVENKDQGIIVSYIKTSGGVFYRRYIQDMDLTYTWDIEEQLEEFKGAAKNINLFITNDYRVGFTIEDSDQKIHWIVTHRNYSDMAMGRDTLSLRINKPIASLEIGEIETFSFIQPPDTMRLETELDYSILSIYEEGGYIYDGIAAIGKIIDTYNFFIEFNKKIFPKDPTKLKDVISGAEIVGAYLENDNKIYFNTKYPLTPTGITVDIMEYSLLVRDEERVRDYVQTMPVKIEGNLDPIEETLSLKIVDKDLIINGYEITTSSYDICPKDTLTLSVLNSDAIFTINEISTDPI